MCVPEELFVALDAKPVAAIGIPAAMGQYLGLKQSPSTDDAVVAGPSAFYEFKIRAVIG